jgi:hypothetical protein
VRPARPAPSHEAYRLTARSRFLAGGEPCRLVARRVYMTTKRNHRAWLIGLSVFAAVLATAIAIDVFGAPTPDTKTDAATATPPPSLAPRSCHQLVTGWKASAADRYFRQAKADAARVARLARAHQAAALRQDGATLAVAVRRAAARPVPWCLDLPGYYRTAMTDLSAAARAAAHGRYRAALRWVRAARPVLARADDELTQARRTHHRTHHRAAARPAPASPSPVATTSGPTAAAPGCYPRSDEGTCYEPGEYCRAADQGVAGIAGDGQTIVCMDDNGLRWEPTG